MNYQLQMQRQRLAALDDSDWTETTWRQSSNDSDVREPIPGLNYARVRDEIIGRSPGLFQVPPAWRDTGGELLNEETTGFYMSGVPPRLPERDYVEHLLRLFRTEVFVIGPWVELQKFMELASALYGSDRNENGVPVNTPRSWLVVFFAILALTAICIQDEVILRHASELKYPSIPVGWELAEAAIFFFGPVTKRNTLDNARGALALAMYFKQLNELEPANLWIGIATKIAQHLGKPFIPLSSNGRRMPSIFLGIEQT